MKTLTLLLLLLTSNSFAQTRNIVPRADDEGGIGLSTRTWHEVWSTKYYGDGSSLTGILGMVPSTYSIRIDALDVATATLTTSIESSSNTYWNRIYVSTVVYSTSGVYHTNSLGTPTSCISASTLTWTASSSTVYQVGYVGTVEHTGTGAEMRMSFLLDGVLPPPLSSTLSPYSLEAMAGDKISANWFYNISVSAGSHSVCFVIWSVSGQCTLPINNTNMFYVKTRD
jgi:hypothetical protein